MPRKLSKKMIEVRRAVADYMRSEGCSCCRDDAMHTEASDRLGKLLEMKRYDDDSGYDFYEHCTEPPKE